MVDHGQAMWTNDPKQLAATSPSEQAVTEAMVEVAAKASRDALEAAPDPRP